eukprot:TRINITY_DN108060_c0_g1_i1.p1 TRINITY_DN108060_c0_g1~~TRINITY_DN108060_c0_g1_i1.p1  ORF type:complete len:227 (-),score=39.06 TRINITY_DN108060_c0_g1_i1:256-936(-)
MTHCIIVKLALIGAVFLSGDAGRCPKVQGIPDLNISEYSRASWYVQEQQVNAYQREDQLSCVVATYDVGYSQWWQLPPLFTGEVLSVYNYYGDGRPTLSENGEPQNRLCASVEHPRLASQLLVAPCFLPMFFGGDYWVIGVGTSLEGEYEWAVVSGGRPSREYADGCTTGTGYFNSGLWIFSRTPIIPAVQLEDARRLLRDMNYTLSLMKPVNQTGCSYAGAYLKP